MDVTEYQVEFQWFLSNIVNIVVGRRIFHKKKSSAVISEWVTVSDEAFGFLIVEKIVNCEDWTERGTAKRGLGWKNEGLMRYNYLYKQVKKNRLDSKRKDEEKQYLMVMKESDSKGMKLKKRQEEDMMREDALPDLDDDLYSTFPV